MKFTFVTPEILWSNYSDLPLETKIRLSENQYRKQLSWLHGNIPEGSDVF